MQNCSVEASQIASVKALNARNRKIYRALPQICEGVHSTPWTLSCKCTYPADECLCY